MSRQTTLDIAWWKRKNPILFQLCQGQSSVIIAVNSLLTSKGCFIRLKKQKKILLYLQMLQHTKLYLSFSKISASALFLKLFLKFRKFQPRYSYKIYYKKECMCQAAHQASTDKNNLTKKLPSSSGLFTMSDYKALDINIEARVKPPEVIWHQTITA